MPRFLKRESDPQVRSRQHTGDSIWQKCPQCGNVSYRGEQNATCPVCRHQLSVPGDGELSGPGAPRTHTEKTLARVWAEVLGVERVGIHDNFFQLGGNSILCIRAVTRARQEGVRVTARQLFEHQTIEKLTTVAGVASAMDRGSTADTDVEALREALFRRVADYLRQSLAVLDQRTLLDAVEAPTPADTIARVVSAAPDANLARDDWTEALLRGAAARQSALQAAGGALSSGEVAELLGISVAAVKQRQRRGGLLAIPLANGEWGYPARQFAPNGRVREGLKEVLAAFGEDEDTWVILSFLANPDPVSNGGVAFDSLDDPDGTRALVELARTFWKQGAT